MYDITALKASLDCRLVIEKDLGEPATRGVNEWTFSCPFHSERTIGGFRVWKNGFHCFSCGQHGDVLDWRIKYHGETLSEAYERLGGKDGPNKSGNLPDLIERAHDAAERIENEIKSAQKILEEVRRAESWLRYHSQLNDWARAEWQRCGIPQFWQDYWSLGFDPDHVVWIGDSEWHTPTMTIPIFEPVTWNLLNVRHRLINPPRKHDKYRPERRGLTPAPFVAEPELPLRGKTLIVEGEKKAAVAFLAIDDQNLQALGIPGKSSYTSLVPMLKDCEPIYICLDPDADKESVALAKLLDPSRCRILSLPEKVDDMITGKIVDKADLRMLIRGARRV